MSVGTCHYCGDAFPEPGDLRPYGPGGVMVCYDCANATPERAAATARAMDDHLDAATRDGHAILSVEHGFIPLTPGSFDAEVALHRRAAAAQGNRAERRARKRMKTRRDS